MDEAPKTHISTEHESTIRLDEMGLTPEVLSEAVQQAYTRHAAYVTEDEPLFSRGVTMYCKVTGFLRKTLKTLGWKKDTSQNFELTINPVGSMAIMVAGGDMNTGFEGGDPCTVSSKGQVVKKTIDNGLQLVLFDPRGIPMVAPADGPEIWVLMYYVDRRTKEIRLELSQPSSIKTKAPMNNWRERVILSPIPLEGSVQESPDMDENKSDVIDIDIELR